MKHRVILLFVCWVTCQISDTWIICKTKTGDFGCCNNYEMINDKCTECRTGTTSYAGDQCVPCQYNTFGYKCRGRCICDQVHKCDAIMGCIPRTSITTKLTTYSETTKPLLVPNKTVTTTETHVLNKGTTEPSLLPIETVTTSDTHVISNVTIVGTSIKEGMVMTICFTSCFILTGVGYIYLIHKHRQRLSSKVGINNEEVISQALEPSSYMGVHNEMDENHSPFDKMGLILALPASHNETIDDVYHDGLSITVSTEHGNTRYFESFFAIEEDGDSQSEDRISQKECISTYSSSSVVVDQDNTAYENIYQPLQENWQDISHGYEIPVVVH